MAQFMNRLLATPDDRDCRYLVDIKQGYVDIDEPYWGLWEDGIRGRDKVGVFGSGADYQVGWLAPVDLLI
ncbi:hypothetical protein [Bifidobacterium asteroides]|uniref:hypothetical protein n=1 Tax=Bifidobacterium asteroides TaxID=1684 RepID=UPI0020C311DF|nr:hypothetical protein [Bifidobacterium asteroides]MCP8614149.1 hypothetical protein [Bifidobacterium asteroides]